MPALHRGAGSPSDLPRDLPSAGASNSDVLLYRGMQPWRVEIVLEVQRFRERNAAPNVFCTM